MRKRQQERFPYGGPPCRAPKPQHERRGDAEERAEIAARIDQEITCSGVRDDTLAKACRVTPRTIQNWRRGVSLPLWGVQFKRLGKALGVSGAYLLCASDDREGRHAPCTRYGDRLRALRGRKGLSLEQLAAQTGVPLVDLRLFEEDHDGSVIDAQQLADISVAVAGDDWRDALNYLMSDSEAVTA